MAELPDRRSWRRSRMPVFSTQFATGLRGQRQASATNAEISARRRASVTEATE